MQIISRPIVRRGGAAGVNVMYALFFSEGTRKIYCYQVGCDKGNEQGLLDA